MEYTEDYADATVEDNEVTTASSDDLLETDTVSEDETGEYVDETQISGQGDISDTTGDEAKTVPVDVVESIRAELSQIKAERDKLFDLAIGKGQSQFQQQQQVEEPDILDSMDDEEFLTAGQVKGILEKKLSSIEQRSVQQQAYERQNAITHMESEARGKYSDYDVVMAPILQQAANDESFKQFIMSRENPAEEAYKYAKMMSGEPVTGKTVKDKVSIENKINQNQRKAKTLSSVSSGKSMTADEKNAEYDKVMNDILS